MTTVLLWKEYRQQRVFWLVITGLAILLLFSVGEIMGQGSGLEVFRDNQIKQYLMAVVCVLAVIHGVATGALLLAGDKEDGAMVFLDSLTGKRGPVFVTKVGAGLFLTLSEMLVLAGVSSALGFGSWRLTGTLLALGLDGLVWGLLAGAICRTSLTAVLAGLGLFGASWPLTLIGLLPLIFLMRQFESVRTSSIARGMDSGVAGKVILGLAAGFISWRIYCRDDFSRQPSQWQLKSKLLALVPADWIALLWLAYRQGRVALAACLVTSVVVGLAIRLSPLEVWPPVMMIVGLALGLAAFVPEQRNGNLFQGTQRFSAGNIWTVKVLFWAMVAAGVIGVAWFMATIVAGSANPEWWIADWTRSLNAPERIYVDCGNPVLFFVLWPLYGFCFGLFFGQVTGRAVIALVLAAFIAPLAAAMWVPSLLTGGVPAWQIFIIPALLVLTTRLTQWPAMSGRLLTFKPMLGICAALTLAAVSLVACLSYRVAEVPYGGEPFDVKAFVASLPSNQNLPGFSIREGATALEKEIDAQERPSKVPDEWLAKRHERMLQHVIAEGWSKDDHDQIGPWLDRLFDRDRLSKWAIYAQGAAKLPLGMVEDPRLADPIPFWQNRDKKYERMANLLVARALQLQAKGDSREALDHLADVLALSRHVQNFGSSLVLVTAFEMESSALTGMRHWLRNVGPDKELLRAAQAVVDEHKKSCPELANSIKASYLIYRNGDAPHLPGRSMLEGLLAQAYGTPWEKERQKRIGQDIVAAQLQATKESVAEYYRTLRQLRPGELHWNTRSAALNSVPPKDGPGSELNAQEWTQLVSQCGHRYYHLLWNMQRAVFNRERMPVNATQVIIALARYQADHGKPPAGIREIVPDYLAEIPLDPHTGEPFDYAISTGGVIDMGLHEPLSLPAGQASISGGEQPSTVFPVPMWEKGKEKQP